jgi:hypothetical protein
MIECMHALALAHTWHPLPSCAAISSTVSSTTHKHKHAHAHTHAHTRTHLAPLAQLRGHLVDCLLQLAHALTTTNLCVCVCVCCVCVCVSVFFKALRGHVLGMKKGMKITDFYQKKYMATSDFLFGRIQPKFSQWPYSAVL